MNIFLRRLLQLLRRSHHDADLREEIETHRALRQAALERDGLGSTDAARASRRAMGNVTLAVEDVRDVWVSRTVDQLWQDIRIAVRGLRRSPVFTLVAIATLALGIGANTALFSIFNGLILRPLPVRDPGRLALLLEGSWSYPVWAEVKARENDLFDGAFAWANESFDLARGGQSAFVDGALVSGRFFEILGVPAVRGRTLTPADDTAGAPDGPVAVISHRFWRQHFAGADDAIGRQITLQRRAFTVVGVMPPGFFGPDPAGRRPMRTLLLLTLLLAAPIAGAATTATTLPAQPLVERGRTDQRLNFDLLFDNDGDRALELTGLEVTLLDREGRFFSQRRLDRNGDPTTMSLATLPNRALPAHGRLVVFNPFADFAADAWLGDLRYVATFAPQGGGDAPETRVELRVQPRAFAPKTTLRLPLDGEVFVHDGHDLLAHHRRLDITGGMTTHFGIRSNFMRYAHDFTVADAQGRLFRTDGATPEDWYGYGTPVRAAGDGLVHAMRDGMRDNRKGSGPGFTQEQIMKDLTLFLGNYVVIDHGNGEYSVYAHLKEGSVRVKKGQRIRAGEAIGAMGMSGDAFLVHLHYQLQSGPGFEEGLPSYFTDVRAKTGAGWSPAFTGPVDSGDVIESAR